MKVLEQFQQSKTHHPSDCEDSIFVSDHFAAVIDGVTSKSNKKYNNETPGKACSQLLRKALEELPYNSTANQAVEYLTSTVYLMYKELGIEEEIRRLPSDRAAASIIIYSRYQNEIWMVGDCQCRIDGTDYSNIKPIDTLISDIRAFFIQRELILGKSVDELLTHDTGREFILPLLKRQSIFQNSSEKGKFTYGVIDGYRVPRSEIKVIKLSDPKHLVLTSDGYPQLFDTLEQSEIYLREILKNDPLCFQEFKSTKGLQPGNLSFDDRAYLSLEI